MAAKGSINTRNRAILEDTERVGHDSSSHPNRWMTNGTEMAAATRLVSRGRRTEAQPGDVQAGSKVEERNRHLSLTPELDPVELGVSPPAQGRRNSPLLYRKERSALGKPPLAGARPKTICPHQDVNFSKNLICKK